MARKKKTSTGANKLGAIPTEVDGIQFKSKLEAYCHSKLKENKLKAKYESKTFTILKGFEYKGHVIRPMTYTPDFVGKDFIIECKGYPNDAFPLRWKIFLFYLYTTKSKYYVYLPHNAKEVNEVIEDILNRKNGISSTNEKEVYLKGYKQFLPFMV